MPKASVKRTINCSKEDLINLVLNIEDYPKFIPYCLNAKIYDKKLVNDDQLIIADLTIGKGPFKDTYKSDVKYIKKDDIILVKNIDGPLKYLDNKWQFIKIGKLNAIKPLEIVKALYGKGVKPAKKSILNHARKPLPLDMLDFKFSTLSS